MNKKKIRRYVLLCLLFSLPACALIVGGMLYWDIQGTIILTKPAATLLLEDRYGNFLAEIGDKKAELGYWELPDVIPKRIETAFLAIEDRRFYEHSGIDFRAIGRAMWNNLLGESRQGASTIAMQVARMQRILQGKTGKRTYWNKLCETATALFLVRKFGDDAILRQYLAIVPQGNRIHGAAYAARRYFRKPVQDVSWAEAAILASLPKSPGKMNLFHPTGCRKAIERAKLILTQLRDANVLNDQEFSAATHQLDVFTMPVKEVRPSNSYHLILRLAELFRQTMPHATLTQPIRASIDLRIQEKVHEFAVAAMNAYRASGAGNIAVIVVEKATGKVAAYLGSALYDNREYSGAINYARVPRSSGSTLKPFIYALGLESGHFTPASLLSDAPMMVALPGGSQRIGNADGQDLGNMSYRKALANSRNVPAIHVLANVGIEETYRFFQKIGLAHQRQSSASYGLGMAIGTLYVTLEDVMAAYGVLANDGKSFALRWFEHEKLPKTNEHWLNQDAARQISLFLSDPLARLPVFSRMGPLEYPFPVAVKTGTSQGFRDAWAVAYSAKYLVGVWIGHPEHTRMKDISGSSAARVVKNIMYFLHPDERRGIAEQIFPPPEGYVPVKLCASTGTLATIECPEVTTEYFRPGTEPVTRASDSTTVASALNPFGYEQLLNANVSIQEPQVGGTFVIDPDTPRTMQTISLKATANPAVSELIWYVDGAPFITAAYPYEVRWPLAVGTHTFQAKFARADILSDVVSITVY